MSKSYNRNEWSITLSSPVHSFKQIVLESSEFAEIYKWGLQAWKRNASVLLVKILSRGYEGKTGQLNNFIILF